MLVVLVLLRNLRSVDCGIIWMYSSQLLLAWTSSLRIRIRLLMDLLLLLDLLLLDLLLLDLLLLNLVLRNLLLLYLL